MFLFRARALPLTLYLLVHLPGIHRNLGVHISKVKSVSLDSWTAELVAGMKEMGGNTKANEIYEAYLPGALLAGYT